MNDATHTVYRARHRVTGHLLATPYATHTGALLALFDIAPTTHAEYDIIATYPHDRCTCESCQPTFIPSDADLCGPGCSAIGGDHRSCHIAPPTDEELAEAAAERARRVPELHHTTDDWGEELW